MTTGFWTYSVSLDKCAAILRAAHLPAPLSVCRLPRGEVNAVFRLDLSDGRALILKVQARGPRSQALIREREASRLLADGLGIAVPEVIVLDTSCDLLPVNYALLTYLPGTDGDVAWTSYPASDQPAVMRSLGKTLLRIHQADIHRDPGLRALGVGRTPAEWVAKQRARFSAALERHTACGFLSSTLLVDIERFWAGREHALDDVSPMCLLHGDYHLWNVKLNPPGTDVVGVLDLDQVDIGHPEFDFAAMETGILSVRRELREPFYGGYGASERLDGRRERTRLYTLLRHLDMMLAYQGPISLEGGGGSNADSIARLVTSRPDT